MPLSFIFSILEKFVLKSISNEGSDESSVS
jgi:hypothetical protein